MLLVNIRCATTNDTPGLSKDLTQKLSKQSSEAMCSQSVRTLNISQFLKQVKMHKNQNFLGDFKSTVIQHIYVHLCRRKIWISIKIKPRSYNLHAKLVDALWVIPRTWVTLFGKSISAKTEKCTSVEGLLSPRPRFYQALDRGIAGFKNPRSRYYRGIQIPRSRFIPRSRA